MFDSDVDGFDSLFSGLKLSFIIGPIVQLVRMLACHARGREFKSRWGRQAQNKLLRSSE